MKNKWILMMMIVLLVMLLTACKTADILTGNAVPNKEWELIEESAAKSQVNLYTTFNDEDLKSWLSGKYYDTLKTAYGIEVVVKTLTFQDVITTLEGEALNEITDGSMDLLLIKDDEFTKLLSAGYLYEDISSKVPNFQNNINMLQMDIQTEHGTPLNGYAIPFSREQLVLSFDEDILEVYPMNLEELLQFVKENKETFTYADPTQDATGGEFIRTVLYEIVGETEMLTMMTGDWTEEAIETLVMPGMEFLKLLDPYLLKDDGHYFKKQADIDALYKEGILYFSMSQDFSYVEEAVKEEFYPDGANSFIFEGGTIGDTTYLAIPTNASNKSGALVAINEAISFELQLHKYIPSNYGSLPIFDLDIMSESHADSFAKASVKRSTLRVETLFEARYQELPMGIQEKINNIWKRHMNMQ